MCFPVWWCIALTIGIVWLFMRGSLVERGVLGEEAEGVPRGAGGRARGGGAAAAEHMSVEGIVSIESESIKARKESRRKEWNGDGFHFDIVQGSMERSNEAMDVRLKQRASSACYMDMCDILRLQVVFLVCLRSSETAEERSFPQLLSLIHRQAIASQAKASNGNQAKLNSLMFHTISISQFPSCAYLFQRNKSPENLKFWAFGYRVTPQYPG